MARGDETGALSAAGFHVLMVLSEGASYGYAILKAVASHSEGAVRPDIGTLYRILARLVDAGWVEEVAAPVRARKGARGRPRRYYALTTTGGAVAREEARRLSRMVELARDRNLLAGGAGS
ncbi:MAG: PadR family transcriptional regulator [Gemmatimonadetes bacterium]|nr:PadR family transcriptional regulator [Gemmatimonadota bacterium]